MKRYRVVNMLRQIRLNSKVDLESLHPLLPNSKLYRGRPHMLLVKMSNGRNVQIFRNGTVQILGALSRSAAQSMRCELQRTLRRIWKKQTCVLSNLIVSNLVISSHFNEHISLPKCSNHELTYEPELFPAMLISRWLPVHVAVFHTGKVIVTGLTCETQVLPMLSAVIDYLRTQNLTK